jgi:uncharacterized iron-regulated membrane protein
MMNAAAPLAKPVKKKKKHNRSLFYRISAWLHLWLGLVSGLVVMIVCLTGCIWVFNEEITGMMEPNTRIAWQNKPVLKPSQLEAIALARFPKERISYASYQAGKAAFVGLGEGCKPKALLRVNPYTGEVVQSKTFKKDETEFFRWILNGHRFLWMPPKIGRPIVNYSTLVFVIILVTGLVMWWPRKWTKAARDQGFKVKWKASFKRVNYDLHNVLGFYSLVVLAAIAMTGMVWGIDWWSKGTYWVTSGGRSLSEGRPPKSDSTQAGKYYSSIQAMDLAWEKVQQRAPKATGFYYSFPEKGRQGAPISILIYPTPGKFYDRQSFLFDQHTLQELKGGNKAFDGKFADAKGADKLRRMNYEIHVGTIIGFPGKMLAFLAALIGASLPVTGLIVWLGKKKKSKKAPVPQQRPVNKATVPEPVA